MSTTVSAQGTSCCCDCKYLSAIGTGNKCRIINRSWNETLYPYLGPNENDEQRRIFTWIPGGCDDQCDWKIEPVFTDSSLKFKLKSLKFDEYFYAASDKLKNDLQRRNVFTKNSKCKCESHYWDIQSVPGGSQYFTFRSTRYDEYLYAAQDPHNFDEERRSVFTWKYTSDDVAVAYDWACHWSIQCN